MEETVQMVMHGVGRQEVTENLGDFHSIGKDGGGGGALHLSQMILFD